MARLNWIICMYDTPAESHLTDVKEAVWFLTRDANHSSQGTQNYIVNAAIAAVPVPDGTENYLVFYDVDSTRYKDIQDMVRWECGNSKLALCDVQLDSPTPSACNPLNNEYTITDTIILTSPPVAGTLTVYVPGGGSQTFNPPFPNKLVYSISGLIADGLPHKVIAGFNSGCIDSASYTAPLPCMSGCFVNIGQTSTECNNNGTSGDTSDDWFSLNLQATVSGGSENYVVKIGTYTSPSTLNGSILTITGNGLSGNPLLKADGVSVYTVRIEDAANSSCNKTITIGPIVNCNTCVDTIYSICNNGIDSLVLTAASGLTNIIWYDSTSNTQVGTGIKLIVKSTSIGLSDGYESYYLYCHRWQWVSCQSLLSGKDKNSGLCFLFCFSKSD